MSCTIIKRDGREVNFDKTKIESAILKAFNEVDGDITEFAKEKASNIADYIENKSNESTDPMNIEDIQDLVENGLMSTKRKDVARSYINYRHTRAIERERRSALHKEITEKLLASNVKNQNANIDEYSFGGRKGEADAALMKSYALNYLMSDKARENHLENRIYTHDLDAYAVGMHNCLSIPFDKLLANGFNTRQTDIRPANSISTAFQLIAVLFQLQSLQQFGGVSATHLDWTMVPYVRKSFRKHYIDGMKYIIGVDFDCDNTLSIEDELYKQNLPVYKYAMDLTEREAKQAAEAMYHNLNTLQSRSGMKY